jgi:hypothetical protein
VTYAADVAAANAAKAKCRAARIDHYRAQDRERARRRKLANPGKINAIGRAADERRRQKVERFLQAHTREQLAELDTVQESGASIVTSRQLCSPMFIFELRGVRHYEPWPGENPDAKTK